MKAIALLMEALRTSERSVYSNDSTRRYIPEGFNLHTRRRENLKSLKPNLTCLQIRFWWSDMEKCREHKT
jgi:hypothetical protein